ncbi:hypothetical protein ThvES_00005850 [Thiovulum sp. ES]|nr:hypothetical protein ThvES_00005850 [Thiovulum sp. ES]
MKNKYLLVSALLFTFFISGCSDNNDDNNNYSETTETPTEQCENSQVWNEITEQCEINSTTETPECEAGEVLNSETNTCEVDSTTETPECEAGEVLNSETNTCEVNSTTETPIVEDCNDTTSYSNGEVCIEKVEGEEITCAEGYTLNSDTNTCETTVVVTPECEDGRHWDPFKEACSSCQQGAVWNEESYVCECNAAEGLTALKNGECSTFKAKCDELERFWNQEKADELGYTYDACEVWKDCPTALPNSTLNEETNICECNEYFIKSEDEKICEIDFSVVPNAISGKVFDGVVENATVSVCEIIDGVKTTRTVESGAMCEATNSAGEFRCGFLEETENTVILKAVGGTDLGLDGVESEDDSENRMTTKTVADGVSDGDKVLITPVTSLIAQRMGDSNWTETLSDSMNFIHNTLAVPVSITELSDEDAQVSALIAKLYYTLPEVDRVNVFSVLSKTENISTTADLVSLLTADEKFVERGTLLTHQIKKIANSVKIELSAEEIAQINIMETTLAKMIEFDGNLSAVSTVANDHFDLIFAEDNLTVSDEVLLLIAKFAENIRGDVVDTAKNIQCILENASDKDTALQIIIEWLEDRKAIDGNCETLLEQVEEEIIKKSCDPETEEYISGEGCVEKVVCETGFTLDVETRTCVEVVKDAVNSPEDVPALPNTSPSVIVEDTFPSIPSETAVSMPTDDALDMPSDDDYSNPWTTSGEINDTVPFSAN